MPPPIQLQRFPSKKKPANRWALLFLALAIGVVALAVTQI